MVANVFSCLLSTEQQGAQDVGSLKKQLYKFLWANKVYDEMSFKEKSVDRSRNQAIKSKYIMENEKNEYN